MEKKQIVITGINLRFGGTLSVYYDCLDSIIDMGYDKKYNITAFVHKKDMFEKYSHNITIIEIPNSVGNYLVRLYYEYVYFYFYSKKCDIYCWLSLHDITPNVRSEHIYTYFHNATPFFNANMKVLFFSPTVYLMSLFYKYLYKINIKRNDYVIVQQEWIRNEVAKVLKMKNTIVARPTIKKSKENNYTIKPCESNNIFIYASVARPFKNFEVVCEACKKLELKGINNFEVLFTLSGEENRYSKWLKKKYGKLKTIKWLGFIPREDLLKLYTQTSCLIFPSQLETWGLPISEYKDTNNGVILCKRPYAYETIGKYDKVTFFDQNDAQELSELMEQHINGKNIFKNYDYGKVEQPFVESWNDLLDKLFLYTE